PDPHQTTLFPYTTLFRSFSTQADPVFGSQIRTFLRLARSTLAAYGPMKIIESKNLFFLLLYRSFGPRSFTKSSSMNPARKVWSPDRKSTRLNSSHQIISY